MKRLCQLILLSGLIPLSLPAQSPDTTINGVYIGFNYSPQIFPEYWRAAPISAYGEKLQPDEIRRSRVIVSKALAKYPEAALSHVKATYFLRQMKFFNVPYGGTNSTDGIYLVNQGAMKGYTDLYLEQTFHHEYSSILLRKFARFLDTTGWKNANMAGFIYNDPENGVGAIRNNQSSQVLDSTLCQLGLLTQYGGSSLENDVNTFAQNLFCADVNFWNFVDRYPRIRKKTALLIRFYETIHPLFTEKYFRSLETL
ncbi:MAG: hypothetical protein H7Y42_02560 [Chitinophagaceae bacterium]|nr:hypothetical protein [Chitinophagaceae bacterium]